MTKRKILLLTAVLVAAAAFGAARFYSTHIFLEGHIFSRNADRLDLRGTQISLDTYAQLRNALPACQILWDVPFQGDFYAEDTRSLEVTSFTAEDAASVQYFPKLETLNAMGCQDYALLAAAKEVYPDLEVLYQISVDGQAYPQNTRQITCSSISDEEIALLQYLPALETVHAEECTDLSQIMKLRLQYPQCSVHWCVPIGDEAYSGDTAELILTGASVSDLSDRLPYLPALRQVTLTDPVGSADTLLSLQEAYPNVDFRWQMDMFGITVSSEETQIDLTGIPLSSLEAVEAAMAYFPKAEKLILSGCGIDNETLAAFREQVRDSYKVVWTVEVGYMTVRTDETWFMPGKYEMGLTDAQSYNLRYCEDMVCIDVGHKPITHCEWVAFMPQLKYLIIADTCVTDLTPLTGLKNLIYLEMFISQVKDYSPLLTCTALEDLNICYSYGDPEPIQQMTWLKRLWWADSPIPVEEFQTYLPDTQLMFLHHSSTGNGWREGQNYYDMRAYMDVPIMFG